MSTADIDEDTFKSMVDMGSRHGNIEPSERDLIHRVFRLDDIEISRIMTPEDKIITLADSCTENKFLDIIKNEKHSRYPVYSKTVDNIIGFIHAKDLLRIKPKNPDFSIRSLIRKPALVYADNNALSVFLLLKKNKIHIAVVKDRNEKTAGIITMEDILEELFGEIMDETDMEDENGT
jgi:putative hemolysin